MKKRAIIKIFGEVQGVFFRYHTQQMAHRLGLTGFVRNEQDGSVYIIAEGLEEKLKELIIWCHKGPKEARVTKVDVEWKESNGEYSDFQVRHF